MDKHNTDTCGKCVFWTRDIECCNYGQIMGRSRLANGGKLLPCGGCKFFKPHGSKEIPKRKRWNAMPPKMISEKLPANVFLQMEYLYRQGMMDSEIARELGVGASSVSRWRKRKNLESNYRKKLGEMM